MTGEIKAAAILGLGLVCPGALVLAGVGYLAGQVAGEMYRSAIRDADDLVKSQFEGSRGDAANRAAESSAALGETLAPLTLGVSALWMGVQAIRVREASREAALKTIAAP